MNEDKEQVILERIEGAINDVENKGSTYYFFVSDCKETPNSNTLYIYQLALTLKEKGYKVCMLYQLPNEYTETELKQLEKKQKPIDEFRRFTGVGRWLGEKYTSLPHLNIASGEWRVSPSDFLFIPEVFSSLMKETFDKSIPCKRYVILQNFKYVTEFMPFGDQWASYGIVDAITASDKLSETIKSVFPYVKTLTLPPYISDFIRKPLVAKKLIVNIASPKESDIEHIIKTFYWRYPTMQFVTFRTLKNLPIEEYSDMLREGCITVWYDPETPFGYSAIDAIRSGNILIGKVPETIPEWMIENDTLKDNGIWYNNIDEIPDILAKVIGSWMRDEIPEELVNAMEETTKLYHYDKWSENVDKIMGEITRDRKQEFLSIKNTIKNKMKKEQTDE